MSSFSATHRKRFWTKKKAVIAGIGSTFLIPAAAWAAVSIFGFGSITAGATPTTGELTIIDGQYPTEVAPALAPGSSANVKIAVRNNNAYPVKVTGLIVKTSSLTYGTGTTAEQCDIQLNGTAATFPLNGEGGDGGAGKLVSLPAAEQATLEPNAQQYFTFPEVFTQRATATKLCSVGAQYAVKGQAGS